MLVALSTLGPIVPFVGVGVLGTVFAIPLDLAVVQSINHRAVQVVIGLIVGVLVHVLWGTSINW